MSTRKVTVNQIKHLADLAKLKLSDKETKKFQSQLSEIFSYFTKLQELDTKKTKPTAQVTGLTNILRRDEIDPTQKLTQQEALGTAPRKHNSLFRVKSIFEQRAE